MPTIAAVAVAATRTQWLKAEAPHALLVDIRPGYSRLEMESRELRFFPYPDPLGTPKLA
jgi:hypothetical protein